MLPSVNLQALAGETYDLPAVLLMIAVHKLHNLPNRHDMVVRQQVSMDCTTYFFDRYRANACGGFIRSCLSHRSNILTEFEWRRTNRPSVGHKDIKYTYTLYQMLT